MQRRAGAGALPPDLGELVVALAGEVAAHVLLVLGQDVGAERAGLADLGPGRRGVRRTEEHLWRLERQRGERARPPGRPAAPSATAVITVTPVGKWPSTWRYLAESKVEPSLVMSVTDSDASGPATARAAATVPSEIVRPSDAAITSVMPSGVTTLVRAANERIDHQVVVLGVVVEQRQPAGAGLGRHLQRVVDRAMSPVRLPSRTRAACTARRGSPDRRDRTARAPAGGTVWWSSSGCWWSLM